MRRYYSPAAAALFVIWLGFLAGCQSSPASADRPDPPAPARSTAAAASVPFVRATGTIRAVRETVVLAPQLAGQDARLILTRIISTGARVKKGDLLAEFDRTQQLDKAREAEAKFDDFTHQVEQKKAENRAEGEKRGAEMKQAEADLAKALIELKKGPVVAEIERMKAEVRVEDAQAHIASLQISHRARETAEAAALRILELKRDRQKVDLDRARLNAEKLVIRAPLDGMVALENIWRSGTMGPPQEGDQLWPGRPILRIFDPAEMQVLTQVGETDGAILAPGVRATVYLDAYPDLSFPARLVSASPVAAAAIGSPIKRFAARFQIEAVDPHLLPDLAAAVVIGGEAAPKPETRASR